MNESWKEKVIMINMHTSIERLGQPTTNTTTITATTTTINTMLKGSNLLIWTPYGPYMSVSHLVTSVKPSESESTEETCILWRIRSTLQNSSFRIDSGTT